MRPLLLAWVVFAVAVGGAALADDWEVRRSGFDPRVVVHYKALLLSNPNDGYALGRLYGLYQKHRTVAALIAEFRTLAASHRESYPHALILGHLYRRAGQIELAVQSYERAAKLKQGSAAAPAALGALYQKLGHTKEAREAFERALASSTSPRDKKTHLRSLASLAVADRDMAAARRYYDQLVALEPQNLLLRTELAQSLAKGGSEKDALEQYEGILKRTVDSAAKAEVLKEIGALQAKLGRELEAVATYRRAMSLTAAGHWLRRELTDRIIAIYRGREDLKSLISYCEKTWARKGAFEHEVLGRLYDETGDEPRALQEYRASLAASPQSIDTRVRLIALLERSGNDKDVIAEYRKLVATAPGDPKYQLELAKRLYAAGQEKEALQVLDSCAGRFPDDASVHAALADLYARWGDQKRSMRSAQALVRIEPAESSHIVNLGEQLYLQGQKHRAVETWKRLLQVVPQRHVAMVKLAEVYAQHEMVSEAIELYRKAVKLSPQTMAYQRDLALLLERTQRTGEALREWEAVLKLATETGKVDSKREARAHLIEILNRTFQLRHRLTAHHFLFDGNPPHLDSGFFLAEAYAKLGDLERAGAVYRRILHVQRDNLEALTALEELYRKQRKLAAAVELLKIIAALQPQRARDCYQRIADLLLQLYRDKEALAYAAKAIALGPQDASALTRMGELREKQEDYAGAMASYRQAIKVDYGRVRVHFALARLCTQQGNYAEAEQLYRQIIRTAKTPESVLRAFRLGVDLSAHLGTLDQLEKEVLPLSIASANAESYRRLLVQIYERRVPPLIDQLRYGDEATRSRAQLELRQIGVRGLAPLLEELAASATPKRSLVRTLGYLGNPNAVVPLLRVAEKEPPEPVTTVFGSSSSGSGLPYGPYYYNAHRQSRVTGQVSRRIEAVLALGRIGDERAVPGLVRLLAHREGALRESAAWALSRIKDPRAAKALFQALGDHREAVQLFACAGLGVQADPELPAVLEEVMLDHQRRSCVRAACAWALGATGASQALPSLELALQAGEDDIQRAAAWSLGAIGDQRAIPPLLRGIWTKRDAVRSAVVWALLQTTSPRGQRPSSTTPDVSLVDGKLDAQSFSDRLTEHAASSRGQPAASLAGLTKANPQAIVEGIESALSRHRDVIFRVLGDLDADPRAPSLGPLTVGRASLDASAQRDLDRALQAIGLRVAPAVAGLVRHRDPLLRARALSVYAKLNPRDAGTAVERSRQDPSWQVRVAGIEALATAHARGGVTRAQALRLLAAAVQSGHWREREAAVGALASVGDPSASPSLTLALKDRNGFVREAAAAALSLTGGRGAAEALTASLGDELAQVRIAACRSLSALRLPGVRPQLAQLAASDPDAAVRRAAKAALGAPPPPRRSGPR